MATLHLTLNKKWFGMILSGEKKEEYREIKPYWKSRLCISTPEGQPLTDDYKGSCLWSQWDDIVFKNGYSKNSPTMRVRIKNVRIGEGYSLWGAEPNKEYFVFELGDILETKNV